MKNECELVQDLLLGYNDETLTKESKIFVENHLKICDKCSEKLIELKNDIKENENSEQTKINYFKKLKRKTILKSIAIVILILFALILSIYIYKVSVFTSVSSKYNKTMKSENIYAQVFTIGNNDETTVREVYYKNGKYKSVSSTYTDDGQKIRLVEYGVVGEDKTTIFSEINKTVSITTFNVTKKENIIPKPATFGAWTENFIMLLGAGIKMDVSTNNYRSNKDYYVFTGEDGWKICVDKNTGLPREESGSMFGVEYFPNTEIEKSITKYTDKYKYEFDVVTDDDVNVPSFDGYEVKYVDYNQMIKDLM